MSTRPIRITPTMRPTSRAIPDNRGPRNHIPLPTMYRTIRRKPTTTRLTVPHLTPFRVRRRRPSGTVRRGHPSVSPSHHQRPYKRHPFLLLLVDRTHPLPYLLPYLHLRKHQHQ